ncbi:hypothetical protein [Streptomyces sp. CO7]
MPSGHSTAAHPQATRRYRGSAESGFIRSADEAVDRFHQHVITHLDPHLDPRPATRRRRTPEGADAGLGPVGLNV